MRATPWSTSAICRRGRCGRAHRDPCTPPADGVRTPDTTLDAYMDKLVERGGIVEEVISGEEIRSPSVQLRVTPSGHVELLSTHDQVLGGPSGQSYLGCRFPADFAYSQAIVAEAEIIGARLAREGVIGRFAIDFVSVRDPRRYVEVVCDRDQPSEGRHDPSVPDAAVPHRRPLRRAEWALPHRRKRRKASRRDRSPRIRQPPSADDRRRVRHHCPGTAFTSTKHGRWVSCST